MYTSERSFLVFPSCVAKKQGRGGGLVERAVDPGYQARKSHSARFLRDLILVSRLEQETSRPDGTDQRSMSLTAVLLSTAVLHPPSVHGACF